MEVQLLSYTIDGEALIVHAGKVCYRSNTVKNPGEFIRLLIKNGHESVIEHAVATFEFSGISRACSHQIVRHRLASYSQESQRYVAASDWEPVIPPSVHSAETYDVFFAAMDQAKDVYRKLRDLGMSREDARFVLPNATPTCLVMTANLREWRHFIKMRCDKASQWEIRTVALQVLECLYDLYPNVFVDLYEEFYNA